MRKKIQFTTDVFLNKFGYEECWEDAITNDNETPEQCAERIVKHFNDTLRPGEKRRKVIKVRENEDAKVFLKHEWEKTNLFTIIKGRRQYDLYKCKRCGATGKRFTLDHDILIDYKNRGKLICPNQEL